MTLSPGERAALNRATTEIRKILKIHGWAAMQLRLNINEHAVQSVDYKLHERISVDSAAQGVRS
jgi:hypothetical protein